MKELQKMGYDNISDIFIAEYDKKERLMLSLIKQNTCITV